jgi:hypothetical protein
VKALHAAPHCKDHVIRCYPLLAATAETDLQLSEEEIYFDFMSARGIKFTAFVHVFPKQSEWLLVSRGRYCIRNHCSTAFASRRKRVLYLSAVLHCKIHAHTPSRGTAVSPTLQKRVEEESVFLLLLQMFCRRYDGYMRSEEEIYLNTVQS